jgi:hypothetical protein
LWSLWGRVEPTKSQTEVVKVVWQNLFWTWTICHLNPFLSFWSVVANITEWDHPRNKIFSGNDTMAKSKIKSS